MTFRTCSVFMSSAEVIRSERTRKQFDSKRSELGLTDAPESVYRKLLGLFEI